MIWRDLVGPGTWATRGNNFSGLLVLAASAILLLTTALSLGVILNQLRESYRWVDRTNAVLLQMAAIEQDVLLAESASRAFVLSRDPAYLEEQRKAAAAVRGRVRALTLQVSDNPAQVARAGQIGRMIDLRLAEMDLLSEQLPASLDVARAAMRENQQRHVAAKTRALLGTFRADELEMLWMQQGRAHRDILLCMILGIATGALAVAAGVLGVGIFQRQRHRGTLRETQIELMHVQRLNTMGMTATALAHEVSQPLAAASNYLAALQRNVGGRADSAKLLDTVQRAVAQVHRAGAVIQRLRNFIDKRDAERRIEAPAAIAMDAVALLGTLDETLTLVSDIPEDLPLVLVDRIQIQQVLVNLMRNAIEAMRESPRRELRLSATLTPQRQVWFSLADNGPGLPPKIAARLFKPFVTTKKGGMGVGLSICQTIVNAHGGRIWAEANSGGGTIFHFTLPAVAESEDKKVAA